MFFVPREAMGRPHRKFYSGYGNLMTDFTGAQIFLDRIAVSSCTLAQNNERKVVVFLGLFWSTQALALV
jgi:hypothetical protein